MVNLDAIFPVHLQPYFCRRKEQAFSVNAHCHKTVTARDGLLHSGMHSVSIECHFKATIRQPEVYWKKSDKQMSIQRM
jgi:hypothetical protein